MFIHMATGVSKLLVKNLKGSEFNVPVSARKYFYVHFFKERNSPPKSYGFIPGSPLVGNNNETFYIYTGAFWVLAVRLSLGSRKID